MPVALVVALAMMQSVIMRSDVDVRAEAVIDPLTGLLNRKALQSASRSCASSRRSRASRSG